MKQQLVIEYEVFDHFSELNEVEQDLVLQATKAAENAYAPYSEFHVGAALMFDDNTTLTGNNQENIAYPSGLCAERVALFYAGANFPGKTIKAIAIFAKGDLISLEDSVTPCGSCRQVMCQSEERQNHPVKVILVSQTGKVTLFHKASDLLIFSFGNTGA